MSSQTIAEAFRGRLAEALRSQRSTEADLAGFTAELDRLDCASPRSLPAGPTPATVTRHLAAALDGIGCAPDLAEATRSLATIVNWYQVFQGEGIEPDLARGLVAGQMAGQVGIVEAATIRTGLFLLAPDIHYPLHQHAALEIYFVASGRLTLQHGRTGAPFDIGPGEWSVTPCNRVHALTTHGEPCLVIYAWTGAVEAPNWWWEEGADGSWSRACWIRQPDASWIKTSTEPITPEVLAESGEA